MGHDRAFLYDIIAGKIPTNVGLSDAAISSIAQAVADAIDENNVEIEADLHANGLRLKGKAD